MSDDVGARSILTLAENMLRSGRIGNPLIGASGHVEDPIAVQAPDSRIHSWFVPVTVGTQLAGFFQFLPDGTFSRFSSFQRRPGDLAGCPPAADWLDLNRIRERAEVKRRADEGSGQPFLTYDRTPDHVVWAVPLKGARGDVRLVYVAGGTVYEPPPEDTYA